MKAEYKHVDTNEVFWVRLFQKKKLYILSKIISKENFFILSKIISKEKVLYFE